jgi:uncharacterized protein YqjF (DUF2071 family)
VIIVDTGVVVAMGNRRDNDHQRCTDLLTSTVEPLVLPEPLLVEVDYMLGWRAGARAEATFCEMWRTVHTHWSPCFTRTFFGRPSWWSAMRTNRSAPLMLAWWRFPNVLALPELRLRTFAISQS